MDIGDNPNRKNKQTPNQLFYISKIRPAFFSFFFKSGDKTGTFPVKHIVYPQACFFPQQYPHVTHRFTHSLLKFFSFTKALYTMRRLF